MEFHDLLLARRSVRRFKETPISDEELHLLLDAGMSGPSALNIRPWRFIAVRNKELLERLRSYSTYSNMNGTLAILVCFDPSRKSDYWVQDASAATENILLQAADLGLGACWCAIYPRPARIEKVQEILGLEKEVLPLNLIWIGHPEATPVPRSQFEESQVTLLD